MISLLGFVPHPPPPPAFSLVFRNKDDFLYAQCFFFLFVLFSAREVCLSDASTVTEQQIRPMFHFPVSEATVSPHKAFPLSDLC